MANGMYKTAFGKIVNMDQLRLKNEHERAVGNMNANARGDIVSADGTIIQTRNQRMHEQYKHKPPVDLKKR